MVSLGTIWKTSGTTLMSEPVSLTALLAKYALFIAGFIGALLSLSFVKVLEPRHVYVSVATGSASAHYGTPILGYLLGLPPSILPGVAFLLGLMGMNLIPGLLKVSEEFSKNPIRFIKSIIKR